MSPTPKCHSAHPKILTSNTPLSGGTEGLPQNVNMLFSDVLRWPQQLYSRVQTLKEGGTGQVGFDGRKLRLGKEKAMVSHGSLESGVEYEASLKPTQSL